MNRLHAKIMENVMTTSLRTTLLTAHVQMDTLVHSARQVIRKTISSIFFLSEFLNLIVFIIV